VNLLLLDVAPPFRELSDGRLPVPAWVIWLAGSLVVLGAAAFLFVRLRAARGAKEKRP